MMIATTSDRSEERKPGIHISAYASWNRSIREGTDDRESLWDTILNKSEKEKPGATASATRREIKR